MRSSRGMTRSLQTIVATAMASTMIMPVAADSPPMKTSSASSRWPSDSGSDSTKSSAKAVLPAPNSSKPASAIGSTKMLMASR